MDIKVCNFDELIEKEPYTVALEGIEVGIIKWQGELFAYENNCAHIGGPVCLGGVFNKVSLVLNEDKTVEKECVSEDELRLVCPWHGFEYDLKTGESVFSKRFKLRKFNSFTKCNEVFIEM
ncbi:Rieske (2Fe-2S) protein [Bacillus sp. M6-12]|uniref:Rieske (2Fe-2S) protein n=1 Tax=Bacillus sp. M6-12 TaxID=2054166 RepID=UPI0015E0BA9C|nr:Rieske (2Fe-2S) protein [Bacillus sp. M6-12]